MRERKATKQTIQNIAGTIVKKFEPQQIILFGSWAWGTPGPDSDVDLLVIKETTNTRETARQIDGALFPRFFPLDVLVYTPSQFENQKKNGNTFISDIFKNGKVLYAK